jgi:hypothetical protein
MAYGRSVNAQRESPVGQRGPGTQLPGTVEWESAKPGPGLTCPKKTFLEPGSAEVIINYRLESQR